MRSQTGWYHGSSFGAVTPVRSALMRAIVYKTGCVVSQKYW